MNNNNTDKSIPDAIFDALGYLFTAAVYLCYFVPLGLVSYFMAFLSFPIDIITLMLSFGATEWDVSRAFARAGSSCFQWYTKQIDSINNN
jgi:hypothetical protein